MRTSSGCWTCRLRRKKCDATRPVCNTCLALHILCQYSETKPDWMDGGDRQREKSEEVKREVRLATARKRESGGNTGVFMATATAGAASPQHQRVGSGPLLGGNLAVQQRQAVRPVSWFERVRGVQPPRVEVEAPRGGQYEDDGWMEYDDDDDGGYENDDEDEMDEMDEMDDVQMTDSPSQGQRGHSTNASLDDDRELLSSPPGVTITGDTTPTTMTVTPDSTETSTVVSEETIPPSQTHPQPPTTTATAARTVPSEAPTSREIFSTFGGLHHPIQDPDTRMNHDIGGNMDRGYIMMYMDNIFPLLFPFYRPSILSGGRGWVLELIMESPPMYQSMMCLSSYFFACMVNEMRAGGTLVPGTGGGHRGHTGGDGGDEEDRGQNAARGQTGQGQGQGERQDDAHTHSTCGTLAWDKLLRETNRTFHVLRSAITDLGIGCDSNLCLSVSRPGEMDAAFVRETARIMGGIVQLQRFEVVVGSFDNCEVHLGAAVSLFKRLVLKAALGEIPSTGGDGGKDGTPASVPDFARVLRLLGHAGTEVGSEADHQLESLGLWTYDQAAFRFYTALLVVDDVLLSTSLERGPLLGEFHSHLLSSDPSPSLSSSSSYSTFGAGGEGATAAGARDKNNKTQLHNKQTPLINLAHFIGCENEVFLQIGEIASLDAWKKDMSRQGRLDVLELVARAGRIRDVLERNLERLEGDSSSPFGYPSTSSSPPSTPSPSLFATRIWGYAALAYLTVVVSGWQPANTTVRRCVARIIALLSSCQVLDVTLLRPMAWPVCVAGCLAGVREEGVLRSLLKRDRMAGGAAAGTGGMMTGLGGSGELSMTSFGTLGTALEIMEEVWRNRGVLDQKGWDLARCSGPFGKAVLLV